MTDPWVFVIRTPTFEDVSLDGIPDETQPIERAILTCQIRLLLLLTGLDNTAATPERLAWLACWSRCYQLATATRAGLEADCPAVTLVMQRAAQELLLQMQSMLTPITSLYAAASSKSASVKISSARFDQAWQEVSGRLSAYFAWSLSNELTGLRLKGSYRSLRDLYDPTPARELRADPKMSEFHEMLFGPIPTDTRDELELQRAAAHEQIQSKVEQLERLLTHPALATWAERAKARRLPRSSGPMSFFEFLGEPRVTVKGQLELQKSEFQYYSFYSDASGFLHGSTLRQFLQFGDAEVRPEFGLGLQRFDGAAEMTDDACTRVWLGLGWLKGRLWPNESA